MRQFSRILLAASLVAMPVVASAQIGTDTTAATEPTAVVAPVAAGPRVGSPVAHFSHDTQVLVPRSAVARLAPAPDEGGNHTIVISTLALVLGIILIVVLIAH